MKSTYVLFASVAIVLGLASVGSASLCTYTLSFDSFNVLDSDGNEATGWWSSPVTLADSSTRWSLYLAPWSNAVCVKYDLRISVSLPAHADLWYFQTRTITSGGLVVGDAGVAGVGNGYAATYDVVTPGKQGVNSSNYSYWSTPTPVFFDNSYNGIALGGQIMPGSTSTGNGNGTHGDMASYMHIGANGYGADRTNYKLATMYLDLTGVTSSVPGTFVLYHQDFIPGSFGIIQNNDGGSQYNDYQGMGVWDDVFWAGDQTTLIGDSVNVIRTPEPSTLALLGCGLFGLLGYAWRKRR
jgi:hypothetical protein